MSARPGAATVVGTTAIFAFALAIAAAALWPIYRDPHFIVLAVVTGAVGCGIAIAGALLRWPSIALVAAGSAAYLALGVPLAVPDKAANGIMPTLDGLLDLLASTALAWRRLVTIALPVGDYQGLLVPAFLLLLLASIVGLSIGLRAKWGELGVLAPVAVFLVAIVFGPDDEAPGPGLPLAMLATALLWVAWRRWARRREAIRALVGANSRRTTSSTVRVGSLALAAALVAIAGAASVAAATLVPPRGERDVLRTAVEPPFDPRDYSSPLAGFRAFLLEPTAESVLFEIEGLPDGARVRLATLDTYDGVVYAVGATQGGSGTFTRVPGRIDAASASGESATVSVRIEAYEGVWLPTVGAVERIEFAGPDAAQLRESFYFNETTGTAAVVGGLEALDSYRLDVVVPNEPSAAELDELTPGSAALPRPGLVPDELSVKLAEYVDGEESPGARLEAMLAGLAREGYVSHGIDEDDPPSRSGHSADRLTELLSGALMIGDDEQYAATAALMATELGFPARVVVGFAPETIGGVAAVSGSDASAWIEVHSREYGWVSLDPVPEAREVPQELPEDPTEVSRPRTIVPPLDNEPDDLDESASVENVPDDDESDEGVLATVLAIARVVGIVLLVAALVLSPFLLIVGAKLRRRSLRRRERDVRARIRGGWNEFEDAARDRGYLVPATATRSQVAETVGGARTRALAAVADHATFAPDEPAELDAERVWRAVDELTRAMDGRLTRWQRIRAWVTLTSLRGYDTRRLLARRESHGDSATDDRGGGS